jgi:low temperature requirement protein LtrA
MQHSWFNPNPAAIIVFTLVIAALVMRLVSRWTGKTWTIKIPLGRHAKSPKRLLIFLYLFLIALVALIFAFDNRGMYSYFLLFGIPTLIIIFFYLYRTTSHCKHCGRFSKRPAFQKYPFCPRCGTKYEE